MPALSKKQQRFFGIVRAIQKGEMAPTTPETAKAAADMKKKDVKDFASTKHKGLPEKKVSKEEKDYDQKDVVMKKAKPLHKHLFKNLHKGDRKGDVNNLPGEVKDEITSELGDCLWYISALATDLGIGLDGVVVENIRKLQKRKEKGTIHGSGDKR